VTTECGGSASEPVYGYCGPAGTGIDRTCTAVAYATDPAKTGTGGGTDAGTDATADGASDASDAD
jgi:hypothetical protein